jgi:hypothetical protein
MFQEEVNEATVQYVGVVLDPLKPRIACHNERLPKGVVKGRYGLQTGSFWSLKNATSIADSETLRTHKGCPRLPDNQPFGLSVGNLS